MSTGMNFGVRKGVRLRKDLIRKRGKPQRKHLQQIQWNSVSLDGWSVWWMKKTWGTFSMNMNFPLLGLCKLCNYLLFSFLETFCGYHHFAWNMSGSLRSTFLCFFAVKPCNSILICIINIHKKYALRGKQCSEITRAERDLSSAQFQHARSPPH